MSSIQSSNITSGFIDLATYDELEKYMYGCGDAVAYFVRTTCKSTWFTQVPVILSNASGQPKFGQNWSVSISRAGDYLLQTWLRVGLNQVTAAAGKRLRWTRNLLLSTTSSRLASTTSTLTSGLLSASLRASSWPTTI
jgi:hypothetical protein